ncbi:MAG: CFI-box-CTERM domain-containing protein [Candidatus Xenobiia bacterium LiM19]
MTKLLSTFATLLILVSALSCPVLAGNGTVKDGVINLTVKIEDNVTEDTAIIDNIKQRFTDASTYLYNATAKQNRFGKIVIVAPSAWNPVTGAVPIGDVDLDQVDVKVVNGKIANAKAGAFGGTGCINLGIDNLTKDGGKKTIVHEFGHYGYGLYDEYLSTKYRRDLDPVGWYRVFWDKEGGWSKCTEKVTWEVDPVLCYWDYSYSYPVSPSSPEDNHACIMWFQHNANITDFCNTNHNSKCNCNQNSNHDYKSCWAVMAESTKFSLKLPGSTSLVTITNDTPTFEIRQASKSRNGRRAINIGTFTDSVEAGEETGDSVPIDSTIKKAGFVAAGTSAASLSFSLITPGGVTITPENLQGAEYTAAATTLTYTVTTPQAGTWQMKVANNGEAAQTVTVTANDVSSSADPQDPVIIIEGGTEKTVYGTPEPIYICATVSREYIPVQGAVVYATVKRPDGSEVKVPLSDNDTGGDTMPLDGDYEGYFVSFNGNGAYTVTLVADNSAGTAREGIGFSDTDEITDGKGIVKASSTIPITDNFRRQCVLPAVQVSGYTGKEKFPPGEIEQLTAAIQNETAVRLTWVATGNNEYTGQAASYELRFSNEPIETEEEWNNAAPLAELPTPKQSGELEEFTTPMLLAGTYYFALSARSSDGLLSPWASAMAVLTTGYQPDTSCNGWIESAGSSGKSGCFIATAAFGSPVDPHVMTLRHFRDTRLLTNLPGRTFVSFYYRISPPIAALISRSQALRTATCILLLPVVFTVENPLWGFLIAMALAVAAAATTGHMLRRRQLRHQPSSAA